MSALVQTISDLREITTLLDACGLPTADIAVHAPPLFFGVRAEGRLIGVIGLEQFGKVGLLRSLAVTKEARGRGIGRTLVAHMENFATRDGVKELFLLTTSAADFFRKEGFEPIDRVDAPAEIRATAQFSGLCPTASSLMRKRLSHS